MISRWDEERSTKSGRMASSVPAKSQARQMESGGSESPKSSKWMDIYSHAWFQVLLISFICFCCPGVSHARSHSQYVQHAKALDIDVQCSHRTWRVWPGRRNRCCQCKCCTAFCHGSYCPVLRWTDILGCWPTSLLASGWVDICPIQCELVELQQ